MYAWAQELPRAAAAVCRVDFRDSKATGFLVGPDLVLTFVGREWGEDQGAQCQFVFDVHESADGLVGQGVTYRARGDGRAWSDADHQLHLLRVDGAPGNDLVPGTQRKRGWLALAENGPLPDQRLALLHHAGGGPMRLEFAWTEGAGDDQAVVMKGQTRSRPGRAGAPYCDAGWQVVAVHRGVDKAESDPGRRTVTWAGQLMADADFRKALEGLRRATKS